VKIISILIIFFFPYAASASDYPSLRVPDAAFIGEYGDVDLGFTGDTKAMAATLAVECNKGDKICAEHVANVILWRRLLASNSAGVEYSVRAIVKTPAQFTGIWSSPLLRDPIELAIRMAFFEPIAASAINGGLDGKLGPSTHYAQHWAIGKTAWGRAALKKEKLKRLPDGHIFVVGPLPFRLPNGAKAENKRLSWSRCVEIGSVIMTELYPSYKAKTYSVAAR
jgi:hypothetical protein